MTSAGYETGAIYDNEPVSRSLHILRRLAHDHREDEHVPEQPNR
jgi:hypothetical protein